MEIEEMHTSREHRTGDEMEHLRDALELETRQRLQVQRRLERANKDFEEFVSIASHGLLESLRAIGSYSELIAETYAGRLDSDADLFFGRIKDGVVRMQSLLADMVEYWSTDGSGRQLSLADMEAVLRQAILCADKQMMEGRAIVTHDPLPAVMGNFEMLAKVLQHLVVNAVKFCGASSPRVHISCRREDLEWVFSVQDNGPGIEPDFRERIFGVFKRLHGKRISRARVRARILQEGHRVAWRSHLGGIDTWRGGHFLLHSTSC